MKVYELANRRYATKKYDTSKKIPQEKVDELKEVLRLTPSSINIQPWQFTFVQNPDIKSKLAQVSLYNKEKINQADLLIVFSYADNLKAFQKIVDTQLPTTLSNWYNEAKKTISDEEIKSWFIRQVYIALGIAISTSVALELDSTPMEGIEPDKYKEILSINDYQPICALAVGYRNDSDHNQPKITPKSRRPYNDVIISI
ncbi:MAG: NAD(P)H-dependent oxidoreductase [Moheibacter sp.]